MLKNKRILLTILAVLVIFLLPSIVKATEEVNLEPTDVTVPSEEDGEEQEIPDETETEEEKETADFTNVKFEWKAITNDTNEILRLIVKNVTMVEGNEYRIHFSHNKDEQPDPSDWRNNEVWTNQVSRENTEIYINQKLIEENGDIYIWVCEVDKGNDTSKMLVNGQKIERKAQLPLGRRIEAFFFDEYTSIYCWETVTESQRKVKIKIGIISDISILRAIKNGESNALQKLLDYAKMADSFYTSTVPVEFSDSIANNLHIIDDEYYYVYFELDDENGKYYPVEDVSLYQGCVGEEVGTNLFNYLDNSFEWNLEETLGDEGEAPTSEPEKKPAKTEDKTKAPGSLPYTGGTFVIIVSVLAIIALGIYAYRRNNDLKGI